ncbi:MAG: PAS domain-containing sensor histidine kinase [Pleurocapsa sp. MO_226.B13]|nr:PAS domain-containing sensor histidine kinase [Pleurocapsa sp. MO_226.B13]
MDLIPVTDKQEYLVCDRNLMIVQFSPNIEKYADGTIIVGGDIRQGFPEMIGLESTCKAILSGQQENFALKSITRDRDSQDTIYFNLFIKSVADHLIVLLEDVTELTELRRSFMQQLNEAEITLNRLQRFEYCTNRIIESMRDVLLITTPAGKIDRVNRSTLELFGHKRTELMNQSIDDIIQDSNFEHREIYNLLLASKYAVKKIEVNFPNKQKQNIQIEFDCFIAPTEVKNFFNCVYIGRDITERKRAETEIRKSLAREKELRQLKSGFLSMASHEFRNPLSSILLCVQNLSNENNLSSSEREFYLQSIQDAALNMNSLLEDVLILSKAESGKQTLKPIQLNFRSFCLQIIQELTAIYTDKQIAFNYRFPRDLVFLDEKNIRQILSNLLSNALKYSPTGSTINLNISCNDSENPTEMILEVRDRGIGIPEEAQKYLFDSFYRAGNVGNTPGTGLGLSIVSKAVELYKGSITLDSQIDRGTQITVKLPISPTEKA